MERATISRQQQTQRAFLGAALMDPARAREYIIKLVPGMFDEGVSRAVFSAVQQLTMAGEPVDVITVINRASAGRPADEIRPGVVAMAETCPSVSNIGSYAAQILEDYRYSLLQSDLMKCMAKDAMDSDGVCRQLRRTLAVQDAIRSTQTDSTARDFDAVLDSALARLDEPDTSLKLGWPELDRYGVFHRGRTCVVAGRPGCGKTDFSLNLAARLSKRYKVYYLTLEETAEALMDRILSKVARIDSGKLTNKSLAPREREIINNAAARLRQHHNMMLDADSNLTIDGLEAKLMLDPADSNEVIAESSLTTRDLFDAAKRLYINRDDLAAYKAEVKGKRDQERARQEEAGKWQALARQELEAFDSWPLVTRLKELGLTIRERKMADGGRLIIAVDDLTRFSGHVDGFQYRECFAVRFGPNGERAGRDGDINALEWYKRWYSTGAGIENYIADDIQRATREAKKK